MRVGRLATGCSGIPDSRSTRSDPTRSLLVLTAGDDVLRLAPPLTFDEADVASALAILGPAFDATRDRESHAATWMHIVLDFCIL